MAKHGKRKKHLRGASKKEARHLRRGKGGKGKRGMGMEHLFGRHEVRKSHRKSRRG